MKAHVRNPWLGLMVLVAVLAAPSVSATGDILSFETDAGGHDFLVYGGGGDDGVGGLVVYWPKIEAHSLPFGSTKWHSNREANELRVSFTNPGRKDLPPSFTLNIVGKRGTLTYGRHVLAGKVIWMSGPLKDY